MLVTTQAREGIETRYPDWCHGNLLVTTQAREGIETVLFRQLLQSLQVTTQVREGIDTQLWILIHDQCRASSACPRQKSINFIKVL